MYALNLFQNKFYTCCIWGCPLSAGSVSVRESGITSQILKKAKSSFSFVLNTVRVLKPLDGKHWNGLFVEIIENDISMEFFDPYGDDPNELVSITIAAIQGAFSKVKICSLLLFTYRKAKPNCKVSSLRIHKTWHQIDGINCGVYVVWFLLQKMSKVSFETIEKKIFSFTDCDKLRYTLWNIQGGSSEQEQMMEIRIGKVVTSVFII